MSGPVAHTLRPAFESDHDDISAVIAAAFGAEDAAEGAQVSSLWSEVRSSGLVLAEWVAVDEQSFEVLGHVGVSHAWLDARRALVDVAMLSPLSTIPGRQQQGIGSALVAVAITAAQASDRPMLILEGSPFYYGVRGFERAALHGLQAASDRTPEQAMQVVLLEGHEEWMRGRFVYPDVWWRHEAAGLRDPELTYLEQLFAEKFPTLD